MSQRAVPRGPHGGRVKALASANARDLKKPSGIIGAGTRRSTMMNAARPARPRPRRDQAGATRTRPRPLEKGEDHTTEPQHGQDAARPINAGSRLSLMKRI